MNRRIVACVLTVPSALAFPMGVMAQTPDATQSATRSNDAVTPSDEIVVTAQRREQKLQDVAISVTAIGGPELRKLGVMRVADIVAQVPGVQVSAAGAGTVNAFNIRGVTQNAFAASLESPIATYLDDSYLSMNSIINLSVFDIDRVEVLRGPQGTLFGRNANGGVVRYVTVRPGSEPSGFAYVDVGSQGRLRLEGAVGGPVSDTIGIRVSAVRSRDNGLIKNDIGDDVAQTDDWAVRGQLAIDTGQFDGLLKVQYLKEDSRRGGYSHTVSRNGNFVTDPKVTDFFGYRDADGNPFTGSFDYPGFNKNEVLDLTGTFNVDVGEIKLTSISNYQDIKNDFAEDSDVSPNNVYHYNRGADMTQFTQEIRGSWSNSNVSILAGAYFLRIDGFYFTNQTGDIFFGGATERANANQVTTSYAAFGQVELKLDPRWSVELGARYSNDKKDFQYDSTNIFNIFKPGPVTFNQTFKDDGISLRGQVNFRPDSSNLLYLGVNRGIKSGGLNFPLFPQDPALLPFEGEVLVSYEGGWKATLAPGTTFNLSVFHYDYGGYQAFSFDGLATRIVNTNAKMTGGEAELRARPFEGLDVNIGMSFLDNTVRDVPLAVSSGTEKAPFAPRWTVNGLVRYTHAALGGDMYAQLDGSWRDKQTFNLVPTPVVQEPGYALFNLGIGYTSGDGHWSIQGQIHNLFDKRYRISSFDTSADFGSLEDMFGVRRWIGVTFGYRL